MGKGQGRKTNKNIPAPKIEPSKETCNDWFSVTLDSFNYRFIRNWRVSKSSSDAGIPKMKGKEIRETGTGTEKEGKNKWKIKRKQWTLREEDN